MNARRQHFVREYLIDFNGAQAYIRAGYSEQGAAQGAERLLRDVDVAAAVGSAVMQVAERSRLSVDWVIEQLTATYEHALDARQYATAHAALVSLGKHLGMWPNKISVYDYRETAQRVADELGLDVEDVLAEAKRLTEGDGSSRRHR